MTVDEKRPFIIANYYSLVASEPYRLKKSQLYEKVGKIVQMSPRFVQRVISEWETEESISVSHRGKHAKEISPMHDEDFR